MLKGYIEHHSSLHGLSGWCIHTSERISEKESLVDLIVYAGDIRIRKIRNIIPREDIYRGCGVENAGFKLNFSSELLDLLPVGTLLSVRDTHGNELPFLDKAKVERIGRATDGGAALKKKLANGAFVDKWGALKVPFSAKPERREDYIEAIIKVNDLFIEVFGIVAFPAYGTLLGLARDGRFLDHDDDVDMTYISFGNDIETVLYDFYCIYDTLKEVCSYVNISSPGHIWLGVDKSLPIIDMFTSWITPQNEFFTYFGVGGELKARPLFCRRSLEGRSVIVPDCYEEILAMTYGPNWRIPDPDFQWITPPAIRETMAKLEESGRERMLKRVSKKATGASINGGGY